MWLIYTRRNCCRSNSPISCHFEIDLDFNDAYTRAMLSAISSPALSTLVLGHMSGFMIEGFVQTLRNSPQLPKYPALIHLELYCMSCREFSCDLMNILPNITHLILVQCNAASILTQLSSYHSKNEGATVPQPKLRAIMVEPFTHAEIKPLRDFVAADEMPVGIHWERLYLRGRSRSR